MSRKLTRDITLLISKEALQCFFTMLTPSSFSLLEKDAVVSRTFSKFSKLLVPVKLSVESASRV